MISHEEVLIYGANGYSAQLIVEELINRGIKPALAGRNSDKLKPVAKKFNCNYKVFDLNNIDTIRKEIREFKVVLNCAGPFTYTAEKIIKACISEKVHYLDITGEIPVIEFAWTQKEAAQKAGICIIPSIGFDVIPTDCLSVITAREVKDPCSLEILLQNEKVKISRGTLITTIEMMTKLGKIRREGKIIDSPIGEKVFVKSIGDKKYYGISIPWGDVVSAYYSTGIENITVYLGVNHFIFCVRKFLLLLLKILRPKFVKNTVIQLIKLFVIGPNEEKRIKVKSYILTTVSNRSESKTDITRVMEGYTLTKIGAAAAVENVLVGTDKKGTLTPAMAFGEDFVNQFIIEKIF